MTTTNIKHRFIKVFNTEDEPLIVRSPGRVNIIGEHTDYNEGYVLPAAIDKAAYLAITLRDDEEIHLHAQDLGESFSVKLSDLKPVVDVSWPNYVLGSAAQYKEAGLPLTGFNALLTSDVPIGAGLSSSAAVECATMFSLNELLQTGLNRLTMVKMAQKAEHNYAGVQCGIMDQFASMFGRNNALVKLDCRSLYYEYVPLKLEGYKIVLLNTNVKHSLASSEYNSRREECEQGVAWMQAKHPQVTSLRDATMDMLDEHVKSKDETIYRRCKYVVEEIGRLLSACDDLRKGDINALGKKMFQTHDGLSKEYEVSCKELDFLVEAVRDNSSVLGARMMGGGFGGCTINLVKEEAIDDLVQKLGSKYSDQMHRELTAYVAQIENGTEVMPAKEPFNV